MANQPTKRNRVALAIGIVLVVVSVVLMLGNFIGDSTFPLFLGLLGIITIAISRKKQSNQ